MNHFPAEFYAKWAMYKKNKSEKCSFTQKYSVILLKRKRFVLFSNFKLFQIQD